MICLSDGPQQGRDVLEPQGRAAPGGDAVPIQLLGDLVQRQPCGPQMFHPRADLLFARVELEMNAVRHEPVAEGGEQSPHAFPFALLQAQGVARPFGDGLAFSLAGGHHGVQY